MNNAVVLVGMADQNAAIKFLTSIADGLRQHEICAKVKEADKTYLCLETPHSQIYFIYSTDTYQYARNLPAADRVFGLPVYAKPLYYYLKKDCPQDPGMGLLDWIVAHEKSCEDRDRYVRQDIATTALAGAVSRMAEAISSIRKPAIPEIKVVHFSGPVTCVIWTDGTKTLVRCGENDIVDPEKGLAMAIAKKVLGTNASGSNYYDTFKQWLPKPEEVAEVVPVETEVLDGDDLKASVDEVTPDE